MRAGSGRCSANELQALWLFPGQAFAVAGLRNNHPRLAAARHHVAPSSLLPLLGERAGSAVASKHRFGIIFIQQNRKPDTKNLQAGTSHYGEELRESAEEKAYRIEAQEMPRSRFQEDKLRRHRKGHGIKVKIERRLRQETTRTLHWIADRLKLGTWAHVANRLYRRKKQVCLNPQD